VEVLQVSTSLKNSNPKSIKIKTQTRSANSIAPFSKIKQERKM